MSDFNLAGLLFGNLGGSDDEDGLGDEVNQALTAFGGNIHKQLGIDAGDVRSSTDSDTVMPDSNAVDYEDFDEVIEESDEFSEVSETPSRTEQSSTSAVSSSFFNMQTSTTEDSDDYDVIENTKTSEDKEEILKTDDISMENEDDTQDTIESNVPFRVKRERKKPPKPKSERHLSQLSNKKDPINFQALFSGKTKLNRELRRICSTLHGEDGPILKYTELFATPNETDKSRRKVRFRDPPIEEIDAYPEEDDNELFEAGEVIQIEALETERCVSPPIYSAEDILYSSSEEEEEEDKDDLDEEMSKMEDELLDNISSKKLTQAAKKDNEILFPTSGGIYSPSFLQDDIDDDNNLIKIPTPVGIEQDPWEDKIIWSDNEMTDDNYIGVDLNDDSSKEVDLELLKQMNLWPPKQAVLDVTNEAEIQLPQKRRFVEEEDYGLSSDEEEHSMSQETSGFGSFYGLSSSVGINSSVTGLSSLGSTNFGLTSSIPFNSSLGVSSVPNTFSSQILQNNPLGTSTIVSQSTISNNNNSISSNNNTNSNNNPIKRQKISTFEEVTKYKLPYKNDELENGDWEKDIIWDDSKISIENHKAPPIYFDLNDKNMLYEDDFLEYLSKKDEDSAEEIKDEGENDKKSEDNNNNKSSTDTSNDDEPEIILDKFNLSQDHLYIKRKSSRRKKISKAKVYHSPVALKLSLVRPYLSTEALEYFHKPRTTSIPAAFPTRLTPQILPEKDNDSFKPNSKADSIFKSKKDLSSKDGELIVLEYIEKRPPMLMNIGMASKLVNYTRKKEEQDDDSDNEYESGETIVLEPTEDSPFLGDVLPGRTVRSIDNNMFRIPVIQHEPANTDFLLIKSKDDKKLHIRPLPDLFAGGQVQPMMEVPAPNSRPANLFRKNRLQAFIYRFFKRKSKKHAHRLRIADVCAAFPWHSDANVRKYLKQTATFQRGGDDSGWWTLKPDIKLPTEEQLQTMMDPESLCLFQAMRVGLKHLQNFGITSMTSPSGIQTALQSAEIHDRELLKGIKRVEEELTLTPWNLTSNFVSAMAGRGMLQLTGFGAPLKDNTSFSYVKVPQKVQQSKQKQKQTAAPKSAVTGTAADLRKLSLDEAKNVLLKLGLPESEIDKLGRWERIGKVREMSSAVANNNQGKTGGGVTMFARGARHSIQQQKNQYKKQAQEIFEKQLDFLSTTEIDDEMSSSDSEDEDEFSQMVESMTSARSQEEPERATMTAVPQINSTPRPKNPPPGTKWIKKVTTIKNNDGTITRRTEIIRDHDKVQELEKKMKQNRVPNMKVQLSAEEEQLKSQKRREKRRLQERLRRLKKNKEKQKVLQEILISGSTDGDVLPNSHVPLTCGACGMVGHMRTNRNCPLFSEKEPPRSPITSVEGTKIRISSQAIENLNQKEKTSEKLTISIPKQIVAEADKISDNPDRKPRTVKRGRRTETQLQIALNNVLEKVVTEVRNDNISYAFRNQVNEKLEAPGYSSLISNPMYLLLISNKCRNGAYPSISAFMEDIQLIVDNCYTYNKGRNDYLLPIADSFLALVKGKLEENKEEIDDIEQTMNELQNK